ncbi:conserved hypothetical protein [Ricinus communis]|uniref:Uncharacterized protein n=1 Tax=Ricinus communis TaxID=3988 RepID=B9RL82_RICCO|nr:conserved hypothetical protein [Ricinus communis]
MINSLDHSIVIKEEYDTLLLVQPATHYAFRQHAKSAMFPDTLASTSPLYQSTGCKSQPIFYGLCKSGLRGTSSHDLRECASSSIGHGAVECLLGFLA